MRATKVTAEKVEGLPSYIYQPISKVVPPPVETLYQELPFNALEWKDFERLCCRLVSSFSDVRYSYTYGVHGQAQFGIDIFAKKSDRQKYSVYQCKNVKEFPAQDFSKAVRTFSEKKWKEISSELIICIASPYNTTQQLEEFESQKEKLRLDGVDLHKWDATELSTMLKSLPNLVDDFFGRQWVKCFCGEDAYERLQSSRKLSAEQIVQYRNELKSFYSIVFNRSDATAVTTNAKLNFYEKYILPDVISNDVVTYRDGGQTEVNPEQLRSLRLDQDFYDAGALRNYEKSPLKVIKGESSYEIKDVQIKTRVDVDKGVSVNNKNVILGDAGIGKSAFLKYFTLDMFSERPTLENCIKKWGEYLPIWMPFAFITKQIHKNENISLQKIIECWFISHDEEKYNDLVKTVLDDKKLILIIDGLDEWTDEMAALQALRRIEIFVESKGLPIIYSSRPYGYKTLENSIQNAAKNKLAAFSIAQQEKFLKSLFYNSLAQSGLSEKEMLTQASKNTQDFIVELQALTEIAVLAENPLMLSVLYGQKIRNAILPRNRFQAYNEITQYLIEQHPQRRKTEANITDDVHPELRDYLSKIYSLLAYHIQVDSSEGIYEKRLAEPVVQRYLEDELGFVREKAIKESKIFIELGENFIGILTEKSPKEIAFIHRQFQEFLCAKHISEISFDQIKELIKEKSLKDNWHQVVYYVFHFINRPNEFLSLIKVVEETINEPLVLNKLNAKLLYFNICINISHCPISKTLEALRTAIDEFTFNSDLAYKDAVLEVILQGVQNPKIAEKILDWTKQWNPYNFPYSDHRLTQLSKIKSSKTIEDYVLKVLYNGTLRDQLTASYVFGNILKKGCEESLLSRIYKICLYDTNENVRGLAINSLVIADAPSSLLEGVIPSCEAYDVASAPVIELFNIKAKIKIGKQTDDDLYRLLACVDFIEYEIREEFTSILVDGWKDNDTYFKECLKYINKDSSNKIFFNHRERFWVIFIECFYQRAEAVKLICEHIIKEEHPFGFAKDKEAWISLSTRLAGNNELIAVLEAKYFNEAKPNFYDIIPVFYSALICKTEHVKHFLLRNFSSYSWKHWITDALIACWEKDDEVQSKIKEWLYDSDEGDAVFHIAHKILNDKNEARNYYLEKLSRTDFKYRRSIVYGLISFDKKYFEEEMLEKFIDEILPTFRNNDFWSPYKSVFEDLVSAYPENQKLQRVILDNIGKDFSFYGSLALRLFYEDEKLVETILTQSLPLDLRLRLKMIDKLFSYKWQVEENIKGGIIDQDKSKELRVYTAIKYYNEVKSTMVDSETLIKDLTIKALKIEDGFLIEGFDKQVALVGFTLLDRLSEYKAIVEQEIKKRKNYHIGLDLHSRSFINVELIRFILKHFSTLKEQLTESVFYTILGINDEQDFWEAAARFIERDDQAFDAIWEYIKREQLSISDMSILIFLSKYLYLNEEVQNIFLSAFKGEHHVRKKKIAGDILSQHFKDNQTVCDLINTTSIDYSDLAKVVFLCKSFPNCKSLQVVFNKAEKDNNAYNSEIINYVSLLKVNRSRVIKGIKRYSKNVKEFREQRQFFIDPLIDRIHKDEGLQEDLLELLLSNSASVSMNIFLFKTLWQCNSLAHTELIKWRTSEIQREMDQGFYTLGYDIISNKTVCYLDILNGSMDGMG